MAEQIELDVDIQRVRASLQGLVDDLKEVASVQDSAFKTGAAEGVADAIKDLRSEYDKLKKSADTIRGALKSATDPQLVELYTKSVAELESGMNKLETAGKKAGVTLKETAKEVKQVSKDANTGKEVFEGLFGTFTKAALILAAVEAVKKFVSFAVNLSGEIKAATKAIESFTGSSEKAKDVVNALIATGQKKFVPTDQILQAGKSLLAFGENADTLPDVLGRIADVSAATGKNFNELATIYGKARTAGVLYAEDINQLVDAGIPIIQEFAKQMGVSNDQVKKLASEGKVSFEELQLAIFNLTAEGGRFAGQAALQVEKVGGAWSALVGELQPVIQSIGDEFREATVYWINLARNAVKGIKDIFGANGPVIQNEDIIDREAYNQDRREYERQLAERERIESEAEKARLERAKKQASDDAKIARDREQLRISAMKDGIEKEIAQETFRFKELKRQLRKYQLDTTEAEQQYQINVQNIRQKYILEALEKEAELLELRKAQADFESQQSADALAKAKANLDQIKSVRSSEIDLLEAQLDNYISVIESNGVDEETIRNARLDFDKRIKRERLEAEIEFQEGLLSAIGQGDQAVVEQVKNTILRLKTQLEGIDIPAPSSQGGKDGILFELLGVTDENKEAFERAIDESIRGIQSLAAARVEAARASVQASEEEVRAREDQVRSAEEALDRELQIAELGFASDVTRKRRELEEAQKAEETAKQRRQKALDEQRKAQRAQILLDAALQSSNLITASTDIFKGFSKIPVVGVPLAIAAIALMIGAFVKAKASALQAVRAKEGIQGRVGDRGIIVGPSHDSGGVPLEVEGGEFFYQDGKRVAVVNKRSTSAHFGLLQAINDDDRPRMADYLHRLTAGIRRVDQSSRQGLVGTSYASGGDAKTHELLRENNAIQRRLLKLKENEVITIDMGSKVAIKQGSRTQIKKK